MSMSTSTEVIAHHWAFAIFLIVAIGLCCLMLVGGWFLGGRARARSKNVPFESGIDSVGFRPLTPVRQVLSGGHVLRYLRR